jgi:cyclophilin family peptidyl-prolyl cis-trans isomerase
MKKILNFFVPMFVLLFFLNCQKKPSVQIPLEEKKRTIEMVTDKGVLILELYNETPLHRDNFVQLAQEGLYDSLLFHRVIESFMIQGGDPDSKYAQSGTVLGNGGLDYQIDAEFHPELFHKKGALAAARDGNLKRASSATQFYIVQGKVFNDSLLERAELRINNWLAQHAFKNDPTNKPLIDSLQKALSEQNEVRTKIYNDSIQKMSETYDHFEKYLIPENHREVYKTTGGTPHLDQNYTVFGEVVKGFEIIDAIASSKTDSLDRPISDIRILSVKVLN